MFKRESEQPVKHSYREEKENREKRSLRERLSGIPLRRRVEAVILAVVTVMASLSVDWSSLFASAAERSLTLKTGQSISQVFTPTSGNTTTTLKSAKISVKTPSNAKSVTCTWKVYQNLKDVTVPESGVLVEGVGKTETISNTNEDFQEYTADLSSSIVLNGDETAAVVFTFTTAGGYNITYKTDGSQNAHFLKQGDDWIESDSGECITYSESEISGDLEPVKLSNVPDQIYLTAGQSYTFSEDISWSPEYQRKLTLEKESGKVLISQAEYPTFTVAGEDKIEDGGSQEITIGGDGVEGKDVTVNVVRFKLKGSGDGNSVFTYDGPEYTAAELYSACQGDEVFNNITDIFRTSYTGTLLDGTRVTKPEEAGSYTMTIKGKSNYDKIVYTKDFTIEPKELTQDMFDGDGLGVATVKNGKIVDITDGEFKTRNLTDGKSETRNLVYDKDGDGVGDFSAEITKRTLEEDGVTYEITVHGIGNFKDGASPVTLTAKETAGVSIETVVDHIKFVTEPETYNGQTHTPKVKFYSSENEDSSSDITSNFTENTNYIIKYNGVKRSSGEKVSNADSISDAGEYTAVVQGIGIYGGSIETQDTWVLEPISFTDENDVTVKLKESYFEYSDSLNIKPEIDSVVYKESGQNGQKLVGGKDYVLKNEGYSTQQGDHLVTVLGYGNYEGSATAKYTVFPSLLTSASVIIKDDTVPDGTMKAEKTDDWDYVWTYRKSYEYTGSAFNPEVSAVKIGEKNLKVGGGANNVIKGDTNNNINASTSGNKAYFILTLPSEYAKKKIKVEFEITSKSISDSLTLTESGETASYAYGEPVSLKNGSGYYVKVGNKTLKEGTDYDISYENNKDAGEATITAKGKGNYTGTSSKTFTIEPVDVNESDVTITINPQKLNTSGTVITDMSDVVITAVLVDENGNESELHPFTSEDFELSGYSNNLSAWTEEDDKNKQPQVTLTGKRNLTGTKTIGFQIKKVLLSELGLTWRLTGTSVSGKLGKPGTTDITSTYGYSVDYKPDLQPLSIRLEYSNGNKFSGAYCSTEAIQPGKNTITVTGKGNYSGEVYKFTYMVNKLNIESDKCEIGQTDGSTTELPKFTLSYDGVELTENVDYEVTKYAEKDGESYELKDGESYELRDYGYTAIFTGIGLYEGTRTETFHIGKPFDSEHVFVTMYGPAGTKTEGSDNKLAYFGNNDPYFILTSDEKDKDSIIAGPSYANGTYPQKDEDGALYDISWDLEKPEERHKSGATVTVTFKAAEDNGEWYNPTVSSGVTYTYKVVPVDPTPGNSVSGKIAEMLSVYTTVEGGIPGEKTEEKIKFPVSTQSTWSGNIEVGGEDNKLSYIYTAEAIDPKVMISYDPTATSYASQVKSKNGVPAIDDDVNNKLADPVISGFGDPALFTVTQGSKISPPPPEGEIVVSTVSGGWLSTGKPIQVGYEFRDPTLADTKITFTPANATYTFSREPVDLQYDVTIGDLSLLSGVHYTVVGYYRYSGNDNDLKTIKGALNKDETTKEATLKNLTPEGWEASTLPTDCGSYVVVIGPVEGDNPPYKGYNIAKFSIVAPAITAELNESDFSVTYGDSKDKPAAENLTVKDSNGNVLEFQSDGDGDGYKIGDVKSADIKPRTDATVTISGTGNYKGQSTTVKYKVVANIEQSGGFSTTNLSLADGNMVENNPLQLLLKNDGDLPYIGESRNTFNLSQLTLSDGKVTLPSSYLTSKVTTVDGKTTSLNTVGKKKITVSGAAGMPVTGTRTYYVEVLGDISTAVGSLKANSRKVTGDEIVYTGQSMTIEPVLTFRGKELSKGTDFVISSTEGETYTDVNSYKMTLEGTYSEGVSGKYYKGTAEIPFTIVYDLKSGVEIYYKDGNKEVLLSQMSFPYTGESIGETIEGDIVVKARKSGVVLSEGTDYTLSFRNDTYPGSGKDAPSVTINPVAQRSINSQTVNFSIGGNDLTKDNCTITISENCVYNGIEQKPAVEVTYDEGDGGSRTLQEGEDYKVTYTNNINATTKAGVTVTGINGRYKGSVSADFVIDPKPLEDSNVDFKDVPFGGRDTNGNLLPSKPAITVTDSGKTLKENTDYTITYGSGESADKYFTKQVDFVYEITITGKGNYTGEAKASARQLSGTLNSQEIVVDPSVNMTSVYNGRKVSFGTNGPKIMNGASTLRYNVDYKIEVPDIVNVGDYTIKIEALEGGDYYDNGSSKTFPYTVTPRSVEENEGAFAWKLYDPVTGDSTGDFAWTNSQIKPLVALTDNGITPDRSVAGNTWTNNSSVSGGVMMNGFTVSYGDNRLAGEDTGSVTLTASGNYTGSITKTFAIGTDISKATVSYSDNKSSAGYDGNPKTPALNVSYGGAVLAAGTAYESPVVYTWIGGDGRSGETTSPTEVGSYTPVIKGRPSGGFYGEKEGNDFRITASNKNGDIEITFDSDAGEVDSDEPFIRYYNTRKQEPSIHVYDVSSGNRVEFSAENYDVSYGKNTDVGLGQVSVKLKGNYSGNESANFTIAPYDISDAAITFTGSKDGMIRDVAESSFPYMPEFRLTGTDDDGEEFTIDSSDSKMAGYLRISDSSALKKPGRGALTVSGTGNLTGTIASYGYEVYGKLAESNVSVKPMVDTGVKKDPEVTVVFAGEELVQGTDYSLSVIPYDETGMTGGNVIVTGLGYFGGSVYMKYNEAGKVSSLELRGYNRQYVYSGIFAGPAEEAIYVADSNGDVVIPADRLACTFTSSVDKADCVRADATVTITSKATLDNGSVVDGPSATYQIVQRNISSCDIKKLESDNYTGKALTPPISVSYDRIQYKDNDWMNPVSHNVTALVSGKDYSLSYSDNVYPGTAVVTVTGKGNYTGTKRFMFTIKVADMDNVSALQSSGSTVVSWDPRPHVSGYRVLYETGAVMSEGTTVTLKDKVPARVGVQAYVNDAKGNPVYGIPKYVAVDE